MLYVYITVLLHICHFELPTYPLTQLPAAFRLQNEKQSHYNESYYDSYFDTCQYGHIVDRKRTQMNFMDLNYLKTSVPFPHKSLSFLLLLL